MARRIPMSVKATTLTVDFHFGSSRLFAVSVKTIGLEIRS
jgi:hypothetical protein